MHFGQIVYVLLKVGECICYCYSVWYDCCCGCDCCCYCQEMLKLTLGQFVRSVYLICAFVSKLLSQCVVFLVSDVLPVHVLCLVEGLVVIVGTKCVIEHNVGQEKKHEKNHC